MHYAHEADMASRSPRPRVIIGVFYDRARGYYCCAQVSTAVVDPGDMMLGHARVPWWGAECPP